MRGVSAPGGRADFYQVFSTALHLEDGEAHGKVHNSPVARPVASPCRGSEAKRALGGIPAGARWVQGCAILRRDRAACRLPVVRADSGRPKAHETTSPAQVAFH